MQRRSNLAGFLLIIFLTGATCMEGMQNVALPYPQSNLHQQRGSGEALIKPVNFSQAQMNWIVVRYYKYWRKNYIKPSRRIKGDYKIAFDRSGTTVSEAMGYGMLITVLMAGADPEAQNYFDGLDRFRKRYPSDINPAFMAWKIPAGERLARNDSATDGDMDMAMALLMAHRQWGEARYLNEARVLIHALATTLVRPDCSLRLGDWDTETSGTVLTRTSDFMPTHFQAFREATGDEIWAGVESRCYAILSNLQKGFAPMTGLVPDFAEFKDGHWRPARPGALEGPFDGEFSYNACRVPWRIGWAAEVSGDLEARRILARLMNWVVNHVDEPDDFKAGYYLNGKGLRGANFDSACFISPTGVAAMSTGQQPWCDQVFEYASNQKEGYYEDSVNLLCLLVMSGNTWLP